MTRQLLSTGLAIAVAAGGCASVSSTPSGRVSAATRLPPAPVLAAAPVHPPALPVAVMAPIPNPPTAHRSAAMKPRPFVPEVGDPTTRVARANDAARVQPTRSRYTNAEQVFQFEEGALYQVYAAPGRITDIALEPGEQLSANGPVAAGDTTRWVIGDTASGSGAARRVHVLVKPTHVGLSTNLIVNTERRTYHVELRATPATYMASVSWRYPQEVPTAAPAPPPVPTYPLAGASLTALNFNYRISGDHPDWRPVRVFDDGRQTVIEFPPTIARSEMPPLFISGPDGKPTDLVNYRVSGQRIVVDRLFDAAELKVGDRRGSKRVLIQRTRG